MPAWILQVLWVLAPHAGFSLMLVSIALIGVLGGVIPTVVFASPGCGSLHPDEVPRAMSIVIVGENLGIIVGPPIFGALIGFYQFVQGFYVLGAVSVIMAMALMPVIKILRDPPQVGRFDIPGGP
jgi:MFS family permease